MKQTLSPDVAKAAAPSIAAAGLPAWHAHHEQLSPAMRGVLERMARAGHPPLHTLGATEARIAYEKGANVLEVARAELPRVEPLVIPARDAHPMAARLYAPTPVGSPALPALLYLHGGGFTIGSPATHDVLCRELARRANCIVVSLDYRLAPEHRFPTAVQDGEDAMRWLFAQGARLGIDTRRIAVGGDSAGGTLAAVCALIARDAGLPLSLQLLIYPGTIAHADSASHARFAQGLILDAPSIAWFFDQYIDRADRTDWRFAPALAEDHAGLAPAWFALAELDPLVDEGLAYADQLRMASVPVDLELYRGVTHEFIKLGRVLPEARRFHADAARALQHAFA
jgi:acetyl esterase